MKSIEETHPSLGDGHNEAYCHEPDTEKVVSCDMVQNYTVDKALLREAIHRACTVTKYGLILNRNTLWDELDLHVEGER